MMEGNNDIFVAGADVLGYLARPKHKKYFMAFIWGHPFSTCGSYDQFFDLSHILSCDHMYAFRVPPPFVYVISSISYPVSPFDFARLS